MRIVVAIGGNALLQRGQSPTISTQRLNIKLACESIVKIAQNNEIIITHGNGPQIGLLALLADAYKSVKAYPFDVLGAESQGMIGYLLAQELKNQLPKKQIVVLLTQVAVASDDIAFLKPTKFVGATYSEEETKRISQTNNWIFANDGNAFRRVVPSPLPQRILEVESIKKLLHPETILICLGGGGIPVTQDSEGNYTGIEAVIDKDFSSALLAEQIQAERLVILSDVKNVMKDWGTANETPINKISHTELEAMLFTDGSMGPKVSAACQFVRKTNAIAHIGLLSETDQILQQTSGTTII